MEGQLRPLRAARLLQLAAQRVGVHPDAHAGQLQRAAQRLVPEQNIAVQRPVVIVRGTAVVLDAAFQLAANLHDAHRFVLLHKGILPLLGGQVGVTILQLLRGDEHHIPAQRDFFQLGELPAQLIRSGAHRVHDVPHRVLQEGEGALLFGDDLLPVPLVHVDAVQIVLLLVPADGVHVGHKALPGAESVFIQGVALPLGKAVHHFGTAVHGGNVKIHRPLHAVQIVVQAAALQYEQGRRHPFQVQRGAELLLKNGLDEADGLLGVVQAQRAFVALGDHSVAHIPFLFPAIIKPVQTGCGTNWRRTRSGPAVPHGCPAR